jgi:thiol-disulfide isomerase/thioredoxin
MTTISLIRTVGIMALATLAPLSANADDTAVSETKTAKKARKTASPVVTAVKKVKKVKGRVNDKADYFIYLYSASWCGPCCKEMPEIVELYKDIKKSGKVDIILFCQDKTPAAAKSFVNNFKIKFMTVMGSDDKCAKVPGYSPVSGIPHCIVVDRYGRKITAGHPASLLPSWESLTIEKGEPELPESE